jgi:hypothetical protein
MARTDTSDIDPQIAKLAISFSAIEPKDAIGLIAYLISLLESGAGDQRWLFELIGGICLAQAARNRSTPQRRPNLHIVKTEAE